MRIVLQKCVVSSPSPTVFSPYLTKAGQTFEEALADAQKPRFDFFFNPHLPPYVPMPRETEGFGESNLTAKGVQRSTP